MLTHVIAPTLLVFVPLGWAMWRGWQPHRLLALSAIALTVSGMTQMVLTASSISLSTANETGYHDTYYVVANGHWLVLSGALLALLFVLTWAAARFAHPVLPNPQRVAVCIFVFGWVGPKLLWPLVTTARPRRYIDYAEFVQSVLNLNQIGTALALVAASTLIALSLFALLFRRAG